MAVVTQSYQSIHCNRADTGVGKQSTIELLIGQTNRNRGYPERLSKETTEREKGQRTIGLADESSAILDYAQEHCQDRSVNLY